MIAICYWSCSFSGFGAGLEFMSATTGKLQPQMNKKHGLKIQNTAGLFQQWMNRGKVWSMHSDIDITKKNTNHFWDSFEAVTHQS